MRLPRQLIRSSLLRKGTLSLTSNPVPDPVTGLDYSLSNGASNSDIALIWDGANIIPRVGHTVIVRYKPQDMLGYYALLWHSQNNGIWDSGSYSYGTNPYPTNGAVDSSGRSTVNTGSSGAVHYWEQTGLLDGSHYIATAGGAGKLVVKNVWYTCIRKCRLMTSGPQNGNLEHTFIPDFVGDPSYRIVTYIANSLTSPAAPAFYIGSNDWSASGSTNEENVKGVVRGIQLYNDWLSDTDHESEAANNSYNTAQTSAGQAALWYMNQNPTPSDVTDKKIGGTAHNPTWRNAYRPSLYSE